MVDMDNLAFTSLLWPTDFGKIGLRDYVIFSIAILHRFTIFGLYIDLRGYMSTKHVSPDHDLLFTVYYISLIYINFRGYDRFSIAKQARLAIFDLVHTLTIESTCLNIIKCHLN
jgi:hypothetical protein